MKSIEILALGIRLVGIFCLVKIVPYFAKAWLSFESLRQQSYDDPLLTGFVIGLVVVYFLLTVLLIAKPVFVANILLPKSNQEESIFNGSATDLQFAAFSILGVYLSATSLYGIAYNLSYIYLFFTSTFQYSEHMTTGIYINLISNVVQLVVGLILVVRAYTLVKFVTWLKNYGAK